VYFFLSALIYLPCFMIRLLPPGRQIRKYRWMIAAGLCLAASGCLFRRAAIDGHENRLISFDEAQVDTTRQGYQASVIENGLYSARTVQAGTDMNDAQQKLSTDQRDYDQYLSASGQTPVPLQ